MKEKGFTLIELMIVIAVLGILAAVAIPSYMGYRTRGYNKRAEIVANQIMMAQENFRAASSTSSYASTMAELIAYDSTIDNDAGLTLPANIANANTTSYDAIDIRHTAGDITYTVTTDGVTP